MALWCIAGRHQAMRASWLLHFEPSFLPCTLRQHGWPKCLDPCHPHGRPTRSAWLRLLLSLDSELAGGCALPFK